MSKSTDKLGNKVIGTIPVVGLNQGGAPVLEAEQPLLRTPETIKLQLTEQGQVAKGGGTAHNQVALRGGNEPRIRNPKRQKQLPTEKLTGFKSDGERGAFTATARRLEQRLKELE